MKTRVKKVMRNPLSSILKSKKTKSKIHNNHASSLSHRSLTVALDELDVGASTASTSSFVLVSNTDAYRDVYPNDASLCIARPSTNNELKKPGIYRPISPSPIIPIDNDSPMLNVSPPLQGVTSMLQKIRQELDALQDKTKMQRSKKGKGKEEPMYRDEIEALTARLAYLEAQSCQAVQVASEVNQNGRLSPQVCYSN